MLSELLEKKLKKYIIIGLAGFLFMVLLLTPIIAIAGIVAQPVTTVSQFFSSITNWSFEEDGEATELVAMIQQAIQSNEVREAVNTKYALKLNGAKVQIPTHYIVIPQLLVGIEYDDMESNYLDQLINLSTKCVTNEDSEQTCSLTSAQEYASKLKGVEPFKTKLESIEASVLVKILDGVGSIDFGTTIDPEILEKYKDKLVYPFKKKWPVGDGVGTYNPSGNKVEVHNGVDIQAPCGTATYALEEGIVTEIGVNHPLRGNYIFWTNGTTEFRYLHFMSSVQFRVGQTISKGQFVGSVGTTGYSFGCHLHMEIRENGKVIDPTKLIDYNNPY